LPAITVEGHPFSAGDQLPVGVEAFPGKEPNDVVLWVESHGAVIAGDTLVDFGQGLEIPPEWLPDGVTPAQVKVGLWPLLERPVEHVLATHGGPRDRAALERALSPEPVRRYRCSCGQALRARLRKSSLQRQAPGT
jgi:glyoxylase-like metal-dependent hydrolase (beta-lactamase superfamily II)